MVLEKSVDPIRMCLIEDDRGSPGTRQFAEFCTSVARCVSGHLDEEIGDS
jgi:hypothetical protein